MLRTVFGLLTAAFFVTSASGVAIAASACDKLKGGTFLTFAVGLFQKTPNTAAAGFLQFAANGQLVSGWYINPTATLSTSAPPPVIHLTKVVCDPNTQVISFTSTGGDAGSVSIRRVVGNSILVSRTQGTETNMTAWYMRLEK
jgi:hypothetical protein